MEVEKISANSIIIRYMCSIHTRFCRQGIISRGNFVRGEFDLRGILSKRILTVGIVSWVMLSQNRLPYSTAIHCYVRQLLHVNGGCCHTIGRTSAETAYCYGTTCTLRGSPGFRRPRWPKNRFFFFLLERSPQTVLQLIPKHWGSAANRNTPQGVQRGWGGPVGVNKTFSLFVKNFLPDFLEIWNVYVESNSKNFLFLGIFRSSS